MIAGYFHNVLHIEADAVTEYERDYHGSKFYVLTIRAHTEQNGLVEFKFFSNSHHRLHIEEGMPAIAQPEPAALSAPPF